MEKGHFTVHKAFKNEKGKKVCMIDVIINESLCQGCDKVMLNIQPKGKYKVDLFNLEQSIKYPHDPNFYDLWLEKYE